VLTRCDASQGQCRGDVSERHCNGYVECGCIKVLSAKVLMLLMIPVRAIDVVGAKRRKGAEAKAGQQEMARGSKRRQRSTQREKAPVLTAE
jgi:hypothetical protein